MAVHPRPAPRSPPLSSHFPVQARGGSGPAPGSGLARFNALSPEAARAALLRCCGSRRWAHRMAAHRPYPDTGALAAAADEASYDLSAAEMLAALATEEPAQLDYGTPYAALLAYGVAHAEYERTFGHAFVICLEGRSPQERADEMLAAVRQRLAHEVDEERSVAAEELRRVARARLSDLTQSLTSADGVSVAEIGPFAPVG
ncbi:2-oxo-4-hydroxy-4-carboxy-5-ureidoimidazoline decarboxylase [Streptomyces sp. NPDC051567]|uniref:2-oxo-4-hydroxy-4-carboxy-5-ureidoimidazoline decarboxylase n=1 Tax=Streptomyces sp. NPDC051567 TaxID=3365660 RepID=UPI00378C06E7